MDDADLYGSNLPIFEKLKLFAEWAPLLGRLNAVVTAGTPYDKALAIVSAVQWAAGKSPTETDDEALAHLEAVLRTAEGKAFFDWAVNKVIA